MQQSDLWVERIGDLIVARIRGMATEAIFQERHDRVLSLLGNDVKGKILCDDSEMAPPSMDLVFLQQRLDGQLNAIELRRAIVVSDTRSAFLARLAFTRANDRVFYDDPAAVIRWLSDRSDSGDEHGE